MSTADPGMPPRPTRRGVLSVGVGLGLGSVAAMALSACGIRLEDDAPRVPLIPTRAPIPGESFLLALWQHSTDLADRAASLGGAGTGLPARLAALHRRQSTVLQAELLRLGVPQKILDEASAAPPTTATGTSTTSPGVTAPSTGSPAPTATGRATASAPTTGPKALAAEEASDLGPTAIASLASVPDAAVPLIGSVLAQRSAAANLLGTPVTWPEPAWSAPSLAASYLESTRAAVYAFEVVAAQSTSGAQQTLARATLATLEARASEQETLAGATAEPPALGYPLPFQVTTPAAARKLAVQVVTDLRASVARDLGSANGDLGPLGALVQWLGDTEVLASRWGVPLAPFPGLS
ncbi:protein of unknown function [Pedococcus dokdonensis]|uniref:DUF4439 domain-containing protein n=1 Tax=Pedococcus dokdonensis TaxID=443156 RepID=A0A1H0M5U7_9MICO|nr:DUF4439 domain-containing protein [Pedococcus dokdonensis]SDO75500.1 protein of unknown function [Pedococcus dokdonensis]